jgi:hypothetical protein
MLISSPVDVGQVGGPNHLNPCVYFLSVCFMFLTSQLYSYFGASVTTDTSVPLYQAALKGDWKVAEALFEKYPDGFSHRITERNETALHIAVVANRAAFVKELVKCMTPDEIALPNMDGNTALHFAAGSEIVSIAMAMVKVNEKLPLIRNNSKVCKDTPFTPLYTAAENGRSKMVSYLYPLTPIEYLEPIERIDILVATISTDMYGMSYISLLDRVVSIAIY